MAVCFNAILLEERLETVFAVQPPAIAVQRHQVTGSLAATAIVNVLFHVVAKGWIAFIMDWTQPAQFNGCRQF
jgi:hypothetical protein